jgi:hypothetical protein
VIKVIDDHQHVCVCYASERAGESLMMTSTVTGIGDHQHGLAGDDVSMKLNKVQKLRPEYAAAQHWE